MNVLINFVAFQLGWFASVLGAANEMPWMGPAVILAVITLHLRRADDAGREARLIGLSLLMGLLVDSLLLASGWLQYPVGFWIPGLAPYWIVTMWALFATTLNVSMRWLHARPWLAAALGGIGGPLSYLAGERLGAINLVQPLAAILALAVAWSVAMPLLVRLASRFDGFARSPVPPYIHKDWSLTRNA